MEASSLRESFILKKMRTSFLLISFIDKNANSNDTKTQKSSLWVFLSNSRTRMCARKGKVKSRAKEEVKERIKKRNARSGPRKKP